MPFTWKSNLSVGTLSGILSSSAAAAAGNRDHRAPATSAANAIVDIPRRVTFRGALSLPGQPYEVPCMFGVVLGTGNGVEAWRGGGEDNPGDLPRFTC